MKRLLVLVAGLASLGLVAGCVASRSHPAQTPASSPVALAASPATTPGPPAATTPDPQAAAPLSPQAAPPAADAESAPIGSVGSDPPCLTTAPRHLEVCTAYAANASAAARYPYYLLGHSATQRLASRYTGNAYQLITSQTAGWPAQVDARPPIIRITSVSVAADQNTATLTTVESWRVTTESGQALFEETNQPHTITMQRVPGLLLHKWVVTDIR